MFEYEKTLLSALEAAQIDGLQLRTSADVSDAQFKAIQRPTAVVALGDELAVKGNDRAVLTETQLLVYIVLPGATAARKDEDQFYREEVFQALHGAHLPGTTGPLEWRSTVADYERNTRTYLLTFSAQHARRLRGS